MLLALLLAFAAATAAHAAGKTSQRLLAARVNGQSFDGATRMWFSPQDGLLVPRAALKRWGLMIPDGVEPVTRNGAALYPLRAFDRFDYRIDDASQTLVIQAQSDQFAGQRIDLDRSRFQQPQTDTPGGFINYDVVHESRSGFDDTTRGTIEFSAFNRLGVGTTRLLARHGRRNTDVVRLNTTFRHDDPGDLQTLTLGDTFSRPGAYGRSVQYGGIRWGTNFGTQPDFTTFPRPNIRGETTVPSTVEVYANDQQRARSSVQSGPFSVRQVPVVTGANDVRLVVRDVLGRQRVITRSFYASRQLLRDGLQDYTYEAGSIRKNYTRRSNDYGRVFGAATHRLGVTDRFTAGSHIEVLADQQTAGLSGTWLASPMLGVLSASLAGSTAEGEHGGLARIGIQRQGRRFSFGASTTRTTVDFRQLGLRPGESAPEQTTRARLGTRLPYGSSVGASYTTIARRDNDDTRLIGANYSVGLFNGAALSLFATQELEQDNSFIGITFSASLGDRTSASVSHRRDGDRFSNDVRIQRNTPRGSGLGYRISARDGHGEPDRRRAQVTARTGVGTYRAEAATARGDTAYRLSASGGLAMLGGNAFATRRVDGSFGVVDVGDYSDVTVYNDNQPVANTNDNGAALVPDLREYEDNRLSFEQSDLPLGAQLSGSKEKVVPGYRRGVLVDFEVSSSQGALVTVRRPNGQPLPAGASVRRIGSDKTFPVARRGEVWVTGVEQHNRFTGHWDGRSCRFTAKLPDNPGPMPRIGPVLCEGGQ